MALATRGIRLEVVYCPGVKHSVPVALYRVENTNGDGGNLEDEITCFVTEDPESYDRDFADEEAEDLASLHQPVFARVRILGVESILSEEWVREQAYDAFCRTAASAVGMERTRFALREHGVLVRIAPLDGCPQIVVPQALRRLFLKMNHEQADSEHAGGQLMYETLRWGY